LSFSAKGGCASGAKFWALGFTLKIMSMYDLENQKESNNNPVSTEIHPRKQTFPWKTAILLAVVLAIGFWTGGSLWGQAADLLGRFHIQLPNFPQDRDMQTVTQKQEIYVPQTTQEEAVIAAFKNYSPAVVSIIISKNVPTYEQDYTTPDTGDSPFDQFFGNFGPQIQIPQLKQNGTQLRQVGAGSGFIISSDGMILTNKHVVSDTTAEYTVITSDGKKYTAKVLARDPAQDLALVKIDGTAPFPNVVLGDSSKVQTGQSVIAIGNALGQFDNTVSVGVVSGQARTITAGDSSATTSETLENLIQTDAAINEGNSGGPLLNLKGEVIGVDTAIAQGAQNIGFVIPINSAKRDIDQVKATGKISYPYLGVRYTVVDDTVQSDNKLAVNYGVWVTSGDPTQSAVMADSPAAVAGIKGNDIILQIDGKKIDSTNTLSSVIANHNVGDKITLTVLRGKEQLTIAVTLAERK